MRACRPRFSPVGQELIVLLLELVAPLVELVVHAPKLLVLGHQLLRRLPRRRHGEQRRGRDAGLLLARATEHEVFIAIRAEGVSRPLLGAAGGGGVVVKADGLRA